MQNSTNDNNQTITSNQPINQNQTTIISIILVIVGIVAIILAIITKCILNKRRRFNKRNNRPPQTFQGNGTELRRLNNNGPPQIDTLIPAGSNLRYEIDNPRHPVLYY